MPYDINGRAIDYNKERMPWPRIALSIALAIALSILVAGSLITLDKCSAPQPEPAIQIDTSDERLMHELGLPTREDVEMWRDVRRWGYSSEGVMHTEHVYTQLPGRNPGAWYELYGLEE